MIKNAQNQSADRLGAFLIIEVGSGRGSVAGLEGGGWGRGLGVGLAGGASGLPLPGRCP